MEIKKYNTNDEIKYTCEIQNGVFHSFGLFNVIILSMILQKETCFPDG